VDAEAGDAWGKGLNRLSRFLSLYFRKKLGEIPEPVGDMDDAGFGVKAQQLLQKGDKQHVRFALSLDPRHQPRADISRTADSRTVI
jgi:hypothetical protein